MSARNHAPVSIDTTILLNTIIENNVDVSTHICGTDKLQSLIHNGIAKDGMVTYTMDIGIWAHYATIDALKWFYVCNTSVYYSYAHAELHLT